MTTSNYIMKNDATTNRGLKSSAVWHYNRASMRIVSGLGFLLDGDVESQTQCE